MSAWESPYGQFPDPRYTQSHYSQTQYRQSNPRQYTQSFYPAPYYPQSSYPQSPQSTSSKCHAGLFVNVEFGVSFSEHNKPHAVSLRYASKNMKNKMNRQQQHAQLRMPRQTQYEMTPRYSSLAPPQQPPPRRLVVDSRQERGSSAPPSLADRNRLLSPISPISPPISPAQLRCSIPVDRYERPLPPTPARFRLGDAELPWSTPPSYWNSEDTPPETTPTEETESRRLEDPQRVRDLGQLQQAMMTVDSLSEEAFERWSRDSIENAPRSPGSIGWAIRTEDAPPAPSPTSNTMNPPPYVVSQWESAYDNRLRHVRTVS